MSPVALHPLDSSNSPAVNPQHLGFPTKELQSHQSQTMVLDIRGFSVSNPPSLPLEYVPLDGAVSHDPKSDSESQDVSQRELRRTIVRSLLSKSVGPVVSGEDGAMSLVRSIPTLILYDDPGLAIYDEITDLKEYYLVEAETDILKRYSDEFVREHVRDGVTFIELGCGSMRKTRHLLSALVSSRRRVTYIAVDLEPRSLTDSVRDMSTAFPEIDVQGLLGTYDDALAYLKAHPSETGRRFMCWFGSSIGNFTRQEAAGFLKKWTEDVLAVGDMFVVGVDQRNEKRKIELAYNDPQGVTRRFIMNGLKHVNRILGSEVFEQGKWAYEARYNEVVGRHEAYYRSLVTQSLVVPPFQRGATPTIFDSDSDSVSVSDTTVGETSSVDDDWVTLDGQLEIRVEKDELVHVEFSYKYDVGEVEELVARSGLGITTRYTDSLNQYNLFLFHHPPFSFSLSASALPRDAPPTKVEWIELWKAWDCVTTGMIGKDMAMEKPIALRHPFLFYMGHIPGFMDIQLSRELKVPLTEPEWYSEIFERGIDPDMEDPDKCHAHSRVPDQWPPIADIMTYRDRCRARLVSLLDAHDMAPVVLPDSDGADVAPSCPSSATSNAGDSPKLAPTKQRPACPQGLARVMWLAFEHEVMHLETILYMLVQSPNIRLPPSVDRSNFLALPLTLPTVSAVISFPTSTTTLGTKGSAADNVVGWDNEFPEAQVRVPAFEIQARPVTNFEYRRFLDATGGWDRDDFVPASWHITGTGSDRVIRIKTGLGLVEFATEAQYWPAFTSAAMGEAYAAWIGGGWRLPTEAEVTLCLRKEHPEGSSMEKCNVGFAKWHPTPVTSTTTARSSSETHVEQLLSSGWELTSTVFEGLPGFTPDSRYAGYSADFFDGKHNVVLGGSWATHPRIAGRRSFRNWYQAGYPFVFSKFRLARTVAVEGHR